MRNLIISCLLLALIGALVGCPSLWPFGHAPSAPPSVPTNTTDPGMPPPTFTPEHPQQVIQRWMGWGIPILFLGTLIALAVGFYFRNNLVFYISGACGAGLILDIGLLTYWKVIAAVVLVIILAAVAVGLLLAALRLAQLVKKEKTVSKSLVEGTSILLGKMPALEAEVAKSQLQTVQAVYGTENQVRAILEKEPK